MKIASLYKETKDELLKHIMPFWNGLKDPLGGFYGYMDYNLAVDKKAIKGVILNSRILWFYSNVHLTCKNEGALAYAKHAYEFLKNYCVDKEMGGVYWSLNHDGTPFDDMKHTYNIAFAIYGLTSFYDATKDEEALRLAYELFEVIETKCRDEYGYTEAFDRKWNLIDNEQLSEDGYHADKTMNTLLHIIEAYTELYRVDKNERVREKLKEAVLTCKNKVYNADTKILGVFFDTKMNSIADIYSYGHDIEASWLIDRACEVLADDKLTKEIAPMTAEIVDMVLKTAYDKGAMNNQYCRGNIDKNRVWWVQAESVVGFLNAYEKTRNEEYLQVAINIWNYIKKYLIDKREGSEWFWLLDYSNNPVVGKPIVEPWKCPYHNGRMCMEVIKRYEKL
ncbi:AGE family epimerase/isomerase [Clostridium thermarum]|uniref:AGE family epimerase/isomerase n=1 Tax=Clostridium thermarum TaxID=1716543 RepID=UPI00311AA802